MKLLFPLFLLGLVFALFFVADRLFKDKPKTAKKGSEPKTVKPEKVEASVKNDVKAKQDASAQSEKEPNLADELQRMLENSAAPVSDPRREERKKRTHLLNRNRMRDYFEFKHKQHVVRQDPYAIQDDSMSVVPSSGISLSADDMKRLKMLQEIIERRESSDDFYGD